MRIGADQRFRNDFRDGVRAWRLCREAEPEPFEHGIGDADWCGFLRVDPLDQPHADVDARLDAIAGLAGPDGPSQTSTPSSHAPLRSGHPRRSSATRRRTDSRAR